MESVNIQVKVEELVFSPPAVNYLWDTMLAPEMRTALPADYAPYDFVELMDDWKSGDCIMLLPSYNEKPMGYCWGELLNSDEFEGHCGFFKEFRGELAFEAVRKSMELVKLKFQVIRFIECVPVINKPCIAFLRHLGFTGTDIVKDERWGDCVRLTKEL